ncbi:MAG: Fe-S cluster assembly ATPase SufC [Candidatus Verstraetearchaeota archaeon]|nr:Fe-S cluster assembly ATPase SufC [Candidatus Verstraetearchaeota archaeon]
MLLEVEDLHVSVERKELLKGVDLKVDRGEVFAVMGHNASGKTTLALTLAGFPQYTVTRGKITFDGKDITNKTIDERARAGMALAFQSPPAIRGIRLGDIISLAGGVNPWTPRPGDDMDLPKKMLERVNLEHSLYTNRELNVGFSGGERKRSELAQIFAMRPRLMILDEPDSGVDIDSLKVVGNSLREYISSYDCTVIIITHHRHILQYLKPTRVHIMSNGRIMITGGYDELMPKIEAMGYEQLIKEAVANG